MRRKQYPECFIDPRHQVVDDPKVHRMVPQGHFKLTE